MPKRVTDAEIAAEPHCHICERVLLDKFSHEARGWDWFTGYLPETIYFCPAHANSPKRQQLFRASLVRPMTGREAEEKLLAWFENAMDDFAATHTHEELAELESKIEQLCDKVKQRKDANAGKL